MKINVKVKTFILFISSAALDESDDVTSVILAL